jgi:hypothetical protein
MKARHDKIAIRVAGLERRVLPLPANPEVAGIWGAVLKRARTVMWHTRPVQLRANPCGLAFVNSLDDHMLTDIGLEADAVWREMPRRAWPH